jgi:hypothetical protein
MNFFEKVATIVERYLDGKYSEARNFDIAAHMHEFDPVEAVMAAVTEVVIVEEETYESQEFVVDADTLATQAVEVVVETVVIDNLKSAGNVIVVAEGNTEPTNRVDTRPAQYTDLTPLAKACGTMPPLADNEIDWRLPFPIGEDIEPTRHRRQRQGKTSKRTKVRDAGDVSAESGRKPRGTNQKKGLDRQEARYQARRVSLGDLELRDFKAE